MSWNRQGVGLHSVKRTENGQKGIKANVGKHRETDYRGVGIDRFYCILTYIARGYIIFISLLSACIILVHMI